MFSSYLLKGIKKRALSITLSFSVLSTIFWGNIVISPENVQASSSIPMQGTYNPYFEEVDNRIVEWMQEGNIDSCTFAVMKDMRLVYKKGYGWQDKNHSQPLDTDAVMRIMSNTKPVTASAIRKLVSEGKLNLTDSVYNLLGIKPWNMAEPIDPRVKTLTVQEFLDHKSGIDGYDNGIQDPAYTGRAMGLDHAASIEETISYAWSRNLGGPGYSSVGYQILGKVIEKVSGMSYDEYIRKELCGPIGIKTMQQGHNEQCDVLDNETFYREDAGYISPQYDVSPSASPVLDPYALDLDIRPAGGALVSSAEDYLRYMRWAGFGYRDNGLGYYGWRFGAHHGGHNGTATRAFEMSWQTRPLEYVLIINKRDIDYAKLERIYDTINKNLQGLLMDLTPAQLPEYDMFGDNYYEQKGTVAFEAENYTFRKSATGTPDWKRSRANTDMNEYSDNMYHFSGTGYVDTANNQQANGTFAAASGLDYKLTIKTQGSYNIWIRTRAKDTSSSAVWVGMDNTQIGGQLKNSGNNFSWTRHSVPVTLTAGEHTFNIRTNEDGFEVDKIVLTIDNSMDPQIFESGFGPMESPLLPKDYKPTTYYSYEAEIASSFDGNVESTYGNASGNNYVNLADNSTKYIEWRINSPSKNRANIDIRYSNDIAPNAHMSLSVNGTVQDDSISFYHTSKGDNWKVTSTNLTLNAGQNIIRLTNKSNAGVNIDKITLGFNATRFFSEVPTPTPTQVIIPTPTPTVISSSPVIDMSFDSDEVWYDAFGDYLDGSRSLYQTFYANANNTLNSVDLSLSMWGDNVSQASDIIVELYDTKYKRPEGAPLASARITGSLVPRYRFDVLTAPLRYSGLIPGKEYAVALTQVTPNNNQKYMWRFNINNMFGIEAGELHVDQNGNLSWQSCAFKGDRWMKLNVSSTGTTPTATPTATSTPTITPTATPTVTSTQTPIPTSIGNINIKMFNGSTAPNTSTIYPRIKITNQGAAGINLANLKVRYYYTIDGEKTQSFACDYATAGSSNITSKFVKLAVPKTGADYYCEIGFSTNAGTLQPGASTELQTRFYKNDWSNFTQTGDYSFNSSSTAYTDWNKVTAYTSGTLCWGIEP